MTEIRCERGADIARMPDLPESKAELCMGFAPGGAPSQRELAVRAETSQAVIARIERGRQVPSLETLDRLFDACDLELRLELVPRDRHDERLIDAALALTPEERVRSAEKMTRVAAAAIPLDVEALLGALDRHGVVHVLIGGLAARLHGSPLLTEDIDVTPATDPANLGRLAAALRELDAKLRVAGLEAGAEFPIDDRSFAGFTSMTLVTRRGFLNLCFRPDGTSGYADLERRAERFELFGLQVDVASLDDIIRSKEAAGRDKDLQALGTLRTLRARLQR